LSIPSCADSLVFARFSNCLGIFQHRPVSLCWHTIGTLGAAGDKVTVERKTLLRTRPPCRELDLPDEHVTGRVKDTGLKKQKGVVQLTLDSAPFRRVRPLLTELGYRRRATVEHKNARARIMRNVVYLSSDKCRNLIRAIIYFTDHGELRNILFAPSAARLCWTAFSSSAQRDLDASSVNRHGDE
jgi:hypothetical protein